MRSTTRYNVLEMKMERTQTILTSACGTPLYTSRKIALQTAAIARKESGVALRAEHCHTCHGYHLAPKIPNEETNP